VAKKEKKRISIQIPEETDALLDNIKVKTGNSKQKILAILVGFGQCLINEVDLNKTYDAVFKRNLLRIQRAEAVKMGATDEQLAKIDEGIRIFDEILAAYRKEGVEVKIES